MAALGAQSIASSYEQLLHVDADGGGNGTTHVSLKDGDNGTTFPLTLATDAVMVTSTNRLEFGDNASYIHQSADGVLDLVSDTEIELTATTIDINGAVDLDGALTQDAGAVVFNEAGADYDFRVEGAGVANALFVDGANGRVGISNDTLVSTAAVDVGGSGRFGCGNAISGHISAGNLMGLTGSTEGDNTVNLLKAALGSEASLWVVAGNQVGTSNRFTDIVVCHSTGVTVTSAHNTGSPDTRTYSVVSESLKLLINVTDGGEQTYNLYMTGMGGNELASTTEPTIGGA